MIRTLALSTLFAAAALAMAVPAVAADPAAGKTVFNQCSACHAIDAVGKRMGPTMYRVFGRKAGAVPGYAYSPALKASGLTWTAANLDKFLANPRGVVPGTKMVYPGVSDAAKRADLISYLGTLK